MQTYLITGANRGIGLELCKQLNQKGDHVIAVCRTETVELKALGINVISGIDITKRHDMTRLTQNLINTKIDVLINNAGILKQESLDSMDFDQVLKQFEVNALGPLMVTHTLLPNLHSGSKIIFITSRMGSIGDNTSGRRYGYRMSKAALNIAAVSLSHDLKEKGIAVGILHPGMVSTDMTNHNGIPAAEAAKNLLLRCEEINLTNTGQFFHANGSSLPW